MSANKCKQTTVEEVIVDLAPETKAVGSDGNKEKDANKK